MSSIFAFSRHPGVRFIQFILGIVLIPVLVLAILRATSGAGSSTNTTRQKFENSGNGIPIPLSSLIPPSLAETAPPSGAVSFCLRNPERCRARRGGAVSILLTPSHWRLINTVNTDINSEIWPETDLQNYDRQEYWVVPTDGYGDCEDYALAKQQRLLDAGMPYSALRLAIVLTARGKRHAVLTVTTSGGDYVLDNLLGPVLAWSDTRFTWLMRQDLFDPGGWSLLVDGKSLKEVVLVGPVSSTCN